MPQPRPRHGAAPPRGLRATLLWPLAALLLVGLVGAGTLRGTPLPDDGTLAGPGYLLLRGGGPDPLTPAGLAARHTAAYAQVTGAFQRHTSLHGAERELLLAVLLVTAVLLWRTARRLDVPDAGCAAAVLALGAVPALAPLHAAPTPAAFGAGWLLLAGWLATRVGAGALPAAVAGGLAALAAVPAVLLAPDALLLLVAGATAAAAARAGSAARRTGVALAGLLVLAGTRVLVGRWDPEPADPRRWGADRTGLAVLSVVLVVVGLLAAWRLPRFRAPAVALTATTVLAVAPPSGRLPALLLCLPLAALLVGALATAGAEVASRSVLRGARRTVLAAAAAVALVGLATAAATQLAGTPSSGPDAAAQLVAWADAELPDDAVLTVPSGLTAEVLHAGADAARIRTGTTAAGGALVVTTGAVPAGSGVLARFGDLTVVDPRPARPTPEQVAARRELAAALLANPTTQVPPADAAVLAAGQVDPRLLTLLAGLAAQDGVGLAALPAVTGEPEEALVRQAVIGSIGGRPLTDDPAAAGRLHAWLDAQRAPYAPDRVTDVDGGVQVHYALVPDPDDLVTGSGGR